MDIKLLHVIADAMNDTMRSNTCGIMHAEHFVNVLRSKGAVAPFWPIKQEPSHGNLLAEAEAIAEEFEATARRMVANADDALRSAKEGNDRIEAKNEQLKAELTRLEDKRNAG